MKHRTRKNQKNTKNKTSKKKNTTRKKWIYSKNEHTPYPVFSLPREEPVFCQLSSGHI